jgi:micrococcal nuclease
LTPPVASTSSAASTAVKAHRPRSRGSTLSACAFLLLSFGARAACPLPPGAESVRVAYVIDGDTVALTGGQHVRLIGINAPEIGHDGAPDMPYARAAKDALQHAVSRSGWSVRIVPGREKRDSYGRELANLYDRTGRNLGELLLHLGLAYPITIPPNDRFQRCYAAAAADARTHDRGVWSLPPVEAKSLERNAEGFMRIVGQVREVRFGRRSVWIDLAGPLKLRIAAADQGRFDPAYLSGLTGARVEVLGWVYHYRRQPRIRLRDPSALRRVKEAADPSRPRSGSLPNPLSAIIHRGCTAGVGCASVS